MKLNIQFKQIWTIYKGHFGSHNWMFRGRWTSIDTTTWWYHRGPIFFFPDSSLYPLWCPCNPHSHRILLVTVWVIVNIQTECFSPNITKQKTWNSPWLGCLRNLPNLEPLCPGKHVDFFKSEGTPLEGWHRIHSLRCDYGLQRMVVLGGEWLLSR